ncbi:MAG: 5-formyltetrahydrofolate cyclo-ligase [Woeseiaceae bacterium]
MPQKSQQQLRSDGKENRELMSSSARAAASQKISEIVCNSPWFRSSETIACYLPFAGEVDTWRTIDRALRMKKRVFAPIIEKNFCMRFREITAATVLQTNNLGLTEPENGIFAHPRTLDVVITPVVAFDSRYNRVGMGGGYFDRTFAFLRHRKTYFHPKLIGVAFDCQKVREIPANPWDIRLFSVITESS